MRRKFFMMAPFAIAGIALFTFIGGTIVRLLWNWLLPELFGFPEITFWQAIGLLALTRILFGGFGRGCRRRDPFTPEDRARFRQRIRDRFGMGSPTRPSPEGPASGVDHAVDA
jgi:hypothetical protein